MSTPVSQVSPIPLPSPTIVRDGWTVNLRSVIHIQEGNPLPTPVSQPYEYLAEETISPAIGFPEQSGAVVSFHPKRSFYYLTFFVVTFVPAWATLPQPAGFDALEHAYEPADPVIFPPGAKQYIRSVVRPTPPPISSPILLQDPCMVDGWQVTSQGIISHKRQSFPEGNTTRHEQEFITVPHWSLSPEVVGSEAEDESDGEEASPLFLPDSSTPGHNRFQFYGVPAFITITAMHCTICTSLLAMVRTKEIDPGPILLIILARGPTIILDLRAMRAIVHPEERYQQRLRERGRRSLDRGYEAGPSQAGPSRVGLRAGPSYHYPNSPPPRFEPLPASATDDRLQEGHMIRDEGTPRKSTVVNVNEASDVDSCMSWGAVVGALNEISQVETESYVTQGTLEEAAALSCIEAEMLDVSGGILSMDNERTPEASPDLWYGLVVEPFMTEIALLSMSCTSRDDVYRFLKEDAQFSKVVPMDPAVRFNSWLPYHMFKELGYIQHLWKYSRPLSAHGALLTLSPPSHCLLPSEPGYEFAHERERCHQTLIMVDLLETDKHPTVIRSHGPDPPKHAYSPEEALSLQCLEILLSLLADFNASFLQPIYPPGSGPYCNVIPQAQQEKLNILQLTEAIGYKLDTKRFFINWDPSSPTPSFIPSLSTLEADRAQSEERVKNLKTSKAKRKVGKSTMQPSSATLPTSRPSGPSNEVVGEP
ncbi:hypothetical protein BS47DRAFT_1401685 [Hydnum rufescens UP504]|uniref:Uncharacterized protein n=1 Tax=Hydnum rufescens UP504 TaxID=1448309 RepID=A0A9P6AEF2_9AGAM|nr:hypothetical protein BS47DRAFT_1401685 [Hydnum rufescens UP504]